MRRYALVTLVALLIVALPWREAEAQQTATPDTREDPYERHMALGIRLYEDRSFEAAQVEFERAYATRAGPGPLINVALCHKGRAKYVEAARVLERALREPRATAEQKTQIEQALRDLRELIATVELQISPATAAIAIAIDGASLDAAAASMPIELSPGSHTLDVRAEGFVPRRVEMTLGAGDRETLQIELVSNSGVLSVEVARPNAKVLIDGRAAPGGFPLRTTLIQGMHMVVIVDGDDRYTASVAIVATKETKVSLDADGLLRVGDAKPRGPDEVELPPVSGVYVLAGFSASGRAGPPAGLERRSSSGWSSVVFFLGPDVHVGYRINRNLGVEGYVRQLFSDSLQAPNSVTQIGVGARAMTNHQPVYFVAAAGAGYAAEAPRLAQGIVSAFHAYVEPQVAGEIGSIILAFGTPLTFMTGAYPPNLEIGARLQVGYGAW